MLETQTEVYRDEVNELLIELETSLLELEERPDDNEMIARVFRAMHTIKGSGAMFGFDDIAAFTHDIETVFDDVRKGKIPVTGPLLDLTLKACDRIRGMIGEQSVDPEEGAEILRGFRSILSGEAVDEEAFSDDEFPERKEPENEREVTYRIRFRPTRDIFRNGTNPMLLLDELSELGECTVRGHSNAIPPLDEIDPEACYLGWDLILTSRSGINAIKDVFIFVEDDCELLIEPLEDQGAEEGGLPAKRIGEILIERGHITQENLHQALSEQKRVGELLVQKKAIDRETLDSALAEQRHLKEIEEKRIQIESTSSVKVPSRKLDGLVDLVGELVITQERLTQAATLRSDPMLIAIAEEMERMTAELRDNTMSIRMLPIGSTFKRFKRLVRDLSSEMGKEVVLETEGGETELDKTVIDRLNDPLVHIIRNSIDHGIETPGEREASGKPRRGTLHLSAHHSEANVVIEITDDGAGMNAHALRSKAVEKGLLSQEEEVSEREAFSLIFEPGFSTAEKITEISGRGVGMDVVKRSIEALRGSVEIDSTQGAGTTVSLKLPLTLAIIDGLMVAVEKDYYVMPLNSVVECIELRPEMEKSTGQRMVNLRDEIVPYVPLRELFGIEGEGPAIQQIVIADVNGRRVGFVVDRVMGEYQTVIKGLGRLYKNVQGISGATILGDGRVALILELPKLLDTAERLLVREMKGKDGKRL